MRVRLVVIRGVRAPSALATEGRCFWCPLNWKGEGLGYKSLNPSLADPITASGSWLLLGRAGL
jgi:hypothetical protein